MIDLNHRVVLVTGGGAGIGRAIALGMAAAGAKVAVSDIGPESAAATVRAVEGAGGVAVAIVADVGEIADVDRMAREARAELGPVDVLVNNAGVTRRDDIMSLSLADWDWIHRVNSRGVFACLQRVARDMIDDGGGRIINMASVAGRGFRDTSNAAYAASKGAVIALTRVAAHQLARHQITVNAVCPGVTRTAMVEDIIARRSELESLSLEEAESALVANVPIQRMNEPEDIANMCVFLASDAARNITGQAMNVDGGIMMT